MLGCPLAAAVRSTLRAVSRLRLRHLTGFSTGPIDFSVRRTQQGTRFCVGEAREGLPPTKHVGDEGLESDGLGNSVASRPGAVPPGPELGRTSEAGTPFAAMRCRRAWLRRRLRVWHRDGSAPRPDTSRAKYVRRRRATARAATSERSQGEPSGRSGQGSQGNVSSRPRAARGPPGQPWMLSSRTLITPRGCRDGCPPLRAAARNHTARSAFHVRGCVPPTKLSMNVLVSRLGSISQARVRSAWAAMSASRPFAVT